MPEHGSIEIGHVCFAHAMQRSVLASESIYWLAKQALALAKRLMNAA